MLELDTIFPLDAATEEIACVELDARLRRIAGQRQSRLL